MSEEPEDFNAFNSWDCLGAMIMLGITPAILNYVFHGQDLVSFLFFATIGLAVAVVVFLLSLITRWRYMSAVVNGLGLALTLFFIGMAIKLWFFNAQEEPADLPTIMQQEVTH